MTRGEILNFAWTVPLWFAAMYNWVASVYYLHRARREEYRTGREPFILWSNDCLTTEGVALRRRGTRAALRFVLICILTLAGGFALDRLVGLH
jgi:hypothetical protein